MWKRAGAELSGTALMVAVGCGSIAYGASLPIICLSFAVAVTTAILIFGPISGAHINPAVSIAFYRHGDLEKDALIPYVSAQITGGILAAIAISGAGPTTIAANHNYLSAFFIEVFITFVLMANILWIISNSNNRIIIASWIGGWVGILAFLFGPATGASMNPARTIGPNLISGIYSSMPLYIISTIIGAWLAAELFLRINPQKDTPE
ncbi:MAG: aquaporin family protein [Candidatus Poseidoniaceae archaeon]|nr:aquaporin family protein [Candidatus Poseidoniaceae archaeon]